MLDNFIENIFYVILGVCLIIYSGPYLVKLLNYKKVKAVCIDSYKKWFFTSDTANKGYCSTFKIKIGNEELIVSENNFLGRKLKKNEVYTIYINIKNPAEIISLSQIAFYIATLLFGITIVILPFFW